MEIVKITDLLKNGQADYKGLDLDKIIAGTQLYPGYSNDAYFLYDGEVVEASGVQVITQATYDEHKNRIESQPKPITPEQLIDQLRLETAQSNAEMFEMILMMSGGSA